MWLVGEREGGGAITETKSSQFMMVERKDLRLPTRDDGYWKEIRQRGKGERIRMGVVRDGGESGGRVGETE